MSQVLVNETSLTAIADAIREKNGETTTYKPSEMSGAILDLDIGYENIPEEAFAEGTPDNSYRFSNNTYNWFLNMYKGKLNGLTLAFGMFMDANLLTSVPTLVIDKNYNMTIASAFRNCENLTEVNISNPKEFKLTYYDTDHIFDGCFRLRTVPTNMFGTYTDYSNNVGRGYMFNNCYSLRELPNLAPLGESYPYNGSGILNLYYYLANNCYTLNQIVDLPANVATMPSNYLEGMVHSCSRLKDFTFHTNNGTPYTRNWKYQTLYLARYVGYAENEENIIGYNSGITADKKVYDDASYQALKDDPDWYSLDVNYSRYNHDSAVNTINSLPDCYNYGGGNNILFVGESGALTDGGAINTLTASEIAIATAKGWTVGWTAEE